MEKAGPDRTVTEEMIQLIAETTNVGTFLWSSTDRLIRLSSKAETLLLGIPFFRAMSYQEFLKTVAHDDRNAVDLALRSAMDGADGNMGHIEFRSVRNANGKRIDFTWKTVKLGDSDSQVVGVMKSSLENRSDDRDASSLLSDTVHDGIGDETTFRLLADTMPQIVWSSNYRGVFDYFNKRWYEYFGTEMFDQPSTMSLEEVAHPDDTSRLSKDWSKCLSSGELFCGEYRLKRGSDGEYRWFIARAIPIYDEGNRLTRWVGTCTDIDEARHSREELERAKAQAENEGRVKDEFLATLSHELRTPLNSILGWSQLMRRTTMNESDFRKGIEIIEKSARLQVGLIEDLLDVSRIIAGKLRLDLQRTNVASVIQAAVVSAHPTASAKGISIIQQVDSQELMIRGDPGRLQQIIWNLISNSLKFTPRGGKIWITLSRADSWIQVEVRDNGIGIPDTFLPHVFERFQQAERTTAKKYDGLGIGLSVVRNLVELHGGTVTARSAGVGKGASFAVRFPPISEEPSTRDSSELSSKSCKKVSTPSHFALKGIRVLVVDDDRDAIEILQAILEGDGADVSTATSVDESLEILSTGAFDVILTDIGMPNKDGYALMREIRAWKPKRRVPPVVALTAFARSEDRTRALVAGFQQHLIKPVEPAELLAVLGNLVQKAVAA